MQVSSLNHTLCVLMVCILAVAAIPYDNSLETQEDYRRDRILPRLLSLLQQKFNYERALRSREVSYDDRDDRDLNEIRDPEKRFKPLPQGRSGGMSLCLWKVCPAAPWLMSKRPRE